MRTWGCAMRKWIIPSSKSGTLSFLAILLFILLFVLSQTIRIIPSHIPESPSFFNSPVHAILLILAWSSGTLALFSGLFSILKAKERAIPVFFSVLFGLFIFSFGAGEVLSPH